MLYEKIIEIIVFLLTEIKNNKQLGDIDVDKLSKLGYTQNEINTAFSWVYSKLYSGEKVFSEAQKDTKSQRFLHDVEQNVISPEAYGYLIQLKELGLLNNLDIDIIIDRAMVSSFSKIELGDMKLMIASYLLDIEDMTDTNSRMMLNTKDTIN
ncbi:MAG: DUF494 domain-containing protein [Chlorobi bacterium]|nr:DUF494 domain-containing protein [Chlorobiota bacterium]MCI0714728.1 DUF494 domain-containing protein [Chlorobiota bacterium]